MAILENPPHALGVVPARKQRVDADGRAEPATGEWVEVKSLPSITETLNGNGHNRGLYFSPDMRLWCGQRCRVKSRLDKIIVDGTGQLRQLRNTVCLEGSTCGCAYMGCAWAVALVASFTYWREIWLRRFDGHGDPLASQH